MYQQFNISANPSELAGAASYLALQGCALRSRNQLVNECIRFVASLSETSFNQSEALEFLINLGLAGEAGKAKFQKFALEASTRKKEQLTGFQAQAELAAGLLKKSRGTISEEAKKAEAEFRARNPSFAGEEEIEKAKAGSLKK